MKKLMTAALAALTLAAFAENYDDEGPRDVAYFQFGLASPLHLPTGYRDVRGLRLNVLYGDSYDVCGCDLGLVGRSRGATTGFQANVYDWNEAAVSGVQIGALGATLQRDFAGVQLCGLLALNDAGETTGLQVAPFAFDGGFAGVQVGGLNWDFGDDTGCSIGAVNVGRQELLGATLGAYNWTKTFTGCQIGAFNVADMASTGCQIGVINCAHNLTGVQIGAVNINQGAALQMMTVVNVNF